VRSDSISVSTISSTTARECARAATDHSETHGLCGSQANLARIAQQISPTLAWSRTRSSPGLFGLRRDAADSGEAVSRSRIEGPAMILVSGGRTSAMMASHIVKSGLRLMFMFSSPYRQGKRGDARVVRRCRAVAWESDLVAGATVAPRDVADRVLVPSRRTCVYHLRNSCAPREPFERLIYERNFCEPVTRYCPQELKIRTMKAGCRARLRSVDKRLSPRLDEPGRVRSNALARGRRGGIYRSRCPMPA